nr:hypothetical protein [Bauldia sp.]
MEERQWVQAVLYGGVTGRRFTQDSPVLPDVWLAYLSRTPGKAEDGVKAAPSGGKVGEAAARDAPINLLIEPWLDTPPFQVAEALRRHLGEGDDTQARVATNRTTVIASLTLSQLVLDLLPLTGWYQEKPQAVEVTHSRRSAEKRGAWGTFDRALPKEEELWEDIYKRPERTYAYPKLLGFIRIAGLIAFLETRTDDPVASERRAIDDLIEQFAKPDTREDRAEEARMRLAERMLAGFRKKFGNRLPAPGPRDEKGKPMKDGPAKLVYGINLNRTAMLALRSSLRTVKADAATSVFSIACTRLTWAVVDCGIDARHPAFLDWARPAEANAVLDGRKNALDATRVTATYDFSYLRELLLGETDDLPDRIKAM